MWIPTNDIQDIEVRGNKSGRHSFITDFIGAETLDRNNAGNFCNVFCQFERNYRMAVRSGRTSGPEIEIGGELVAHPEGDAFAETSDHNTDRGHHRNRGRKSADKDGSPPQRGRKAS